MENKEFNEINTFKSFRNALVNAMKVEIAQLANEQREQKKTRKLANRPKGKSLGDIVEEINNRAYKINILLYYYCWIKHGLKYWANRGVQSYKDYYKYYYKVDDKESWFIKNWDNVIELLGNKRKTHGTVIMENAVSFYRKKCEEYNIECNKMNLESIISINKA